MAIRLSTGARTKMAGTQGLKALFEGGFINVYSGGQPTSADGAETGNLLVTISKVSGTDGITLGTAASGQIPKSSDIMSGLVGTAGIAGWFRLYDSNKTTGSNGTANRIDGNIGVSGSDLVLSNTSMVVGATLTIDTFTLEVPAS